MHKFEQVAFLIVCLGATYNPHVVGACYTAIMNGVQSSVPAIVDGCTDSPAKMALDLLAHAATPGSVAPEWFAHTQMEIKL